MSDKKKREIYPTDTAVIIENADNTSYSDVDKERLKIQSFRINDEMVNQQIGIPQLVEITVISQGAISQYKSGRVLIKEDLVIPLAKALNVSPNYLRGFSNAKKFDNDELNKRFGFSDKTISNLESIKNKSLLNLIFENDEMEINFLLEQTMNFVVAKNKLNKFQEEHSDDDRLEYNATYSELYHDVELARFNMSQEYIRLIENNLK